MTNAIVAHNLSVTMSDGFRALHDVNAEIKEGKITGLIGPSGAGKTTLIRCLVGRQALTGGSLKMFGLPVGSAKLRGQFSYMTQQVSIYNDVTVLQNLVYFAKMLGYNRADAMAAVQDVLAAVQLQEQAGQVAETLSGGQKQRVSLAIALLGRPRLMLLDEPTVGLDPLLRRELWSLFRQLAVGGTTIVLTSHVMDEAANCDDLLLIRDGGLLAQGSPAQLEAHTHSKNVEESFLKLIGDRYES